MKVIILRGISGSGKTTYHKQHYPNAYVCSADNYFLDGDGNYNFDAKLLGEAHKGCMTTFLTIMKNKKYVPKDTVVVIDNTNIELHDLTPYLRVAESYNCEVEIIRIECDPECAFKRNMHKVPNATIQRMYRNLKPIFGRYPKETVIKTD